jgi:hypothetical protein
VQHRLLKGGEPEVKVRKLRKEIGVFRENEIIELNKEAYLTVG